MRTTPFAIHVTWTCYGTRLPGDERGYVSNTLLADDSYAPGERQYGMPVMKDDSETRSRAVTLQKHETVWLVREQAVCVAVNLLKAVEARGWWIPRAAVMANHTHVLVGSCPQDGPTVRRILKGVSQAALSRQHGSPRRWWTENGSNRYKFDQPAIDAAIEYIARQEGMLAGIDDMRALVVEADGTIRFVDAVI
jgi:REP element-mobilizing transposase RayT